VFQIINIIAFTFLAIIKVNNKLRHFLRHYPSTCLKEMRNTKIITVSIVRLLAEIRTGGLLEHTTRMSTTVPNNQFEMSDVVN
jgi:hypothetical protein